jgi:PAS domain S-box-containing protein
MPAQRKRVSSRLDLLQLITREFNANLGSKQVLQNVLSATVAAVGAADARLLLFDPQGQPEYDYTLSNFELSNRTASRQPALEEGALAWVQAHRQGVLIQDTATDERWQPRDSFAAVGSAICVPLQIPDQLVGLLTVTSPQSHQFDRNDLSMLNIIADQAAFALSNARLFEAEQQRRRLADTLTSISQTLNASLDLDEVLSAILTQLRLVVDYDSSSIMLFEDESNVLTVRAANGFTQMEDALRVRLIYNEESPNYQALHLKMPVYVPDIDQEPNWIKSISSEQVKSWIGAPLIARGEAVGILTVDSYQADHYNSENIKLVSAFANQAATAVANAQAVRQLKNAENTYGVLFEDSTDLILITTYDGLILDINRKACQLLRRPKDFFLRNDITFIDPRLKSYLVEQTKRLQVWREPSVEMELKNAYGESLPLEIKLRQIQYKGRDCVEWVGRDISARRELEKMREDMVHMLVHDLRGPLGSMLNVIELIQMIRAQDPAHERISHFLEMAYRTGQAVKDMVDSMMDASRLESGEIPVQREPTDLNQLLLAVREQTEPPANARQTELILEPLPEGLDKVWIDPNLIRRTLVNIVGNAIKYTPPQGRVSLTTSLSEGGHLCFAITDNGPGISPADQATIFEKFSRLDKTAGSVSGVGLGLAFCKLAVEAHGGTITVESEGLAGRGSTFIVNLPLVEPE